MHLNDFHVVKYLEKISEFFSELKNKNIEEIRSDISEYLVNTINKYSLYWEEDKAIFAKFKENIVSDIENSSSVDLLKLIMIFNIYEGLSTENQKEFLSGGHFFAYDGGVLYRILSEIGFERQSSHHNDVKTTNDIGINSGNSFRHLLVGVRGHISWFQIEKTPWHGKASLLDIMKNIVIHPADTLLHFIDFLIYKWTGENIGQYGKSPYVDSNPIKLSFSIDAHISFYDVNYNNHVEECMEIKDTISELQDIINYIDELEYQLVEGEVLLED